MRFRMAIRHRIAERLQPLFQGRRLLSDGCWTRICNRWPWLADAADIRPGRVNHYARVGPPGHAPIPPRRISCL